MTLDAVITLLVLVGIVAARNRLAPGTAMLGATMVLVVLHVLPTSQALSGFADPGVATVGALYVIARAMQRTNALGPLLGALLQRGRSWRADLLRILVPSATLSGFVNNTPIVTMMVPPLTAWADEHRRPTSRYLLPMTYAVSLGGTLTLIGTSTNLVVSGLMVKAGLPGLGMFELTAIGIPVAVVGVAVLIAVAPRVLGERRAAREALGDNVRDFAVTMTVVPGGPLDQQTVDAAGLRALHAVFLVEIRRAHQMIAPVTPATVLESGDQLVFVGRADDVLDLQRIRGLASSEHRHFESFVTGQHAFFEGVVGPGSVLAGRTLKQVGFRSRFQGAVIAIHRGGERIHAKLGTVTLRAGDTLLFVADPGFRRSDFLIVNRIGMHLSQWRQRRGRWVGLLFVAVVALASTGVLPLLHAAFIAAAVVVASRVLTATEAREAIDLEVIFVVAGSFAIGSAVHTSGLAANLGGALVAAAEPFGPHGALLAITLSTVALAQVLTCNAAAAVGIPLAFNVAHQLGLDPRPFAIAVAIAASSSYMTPLGYQTKIMVYGPGGYRFGDYFRLGAPLTVAVVAVTVGVVPLIWPL